MFNRKSEKKTAQVDVSEAGLGIGSRIAPAVALLMLGEAAFADDDSEPDLDDDSPVGVPEPSVLSLLAVGAVVVGAARYIHNKRRK